MEAQAEFGEDQIRWVTKKYSRDTLETLLADAQELRHKGIVPLDMAHLGKILADTHSLTSENCRRDCNLAISDPEDEKFFEGCHAIVRVALVALISCHGDVAWRVNEDGKSIRALATLLRSNEVALRKARNGAIETEAYLRTVEIEERVRNYSEGMTHHLAHLQRLTKKYRLVVEGWVSTANAPIDYQEPMVYECSFCRLGKAKHFRTDEHSWAKINEGVESFTHILWMLQHAHVDGYTFDLDQMTERLTSTEALKDFYDASHPFFFLERKLRRIPNFENKGLKLLRWFAVENVRRLIMSHRNMKDIRIWLAEDPCTCDGMTAATCFFSNLMEPQAVAVLNSYGIDPMEIYRAHYPPYLHQCP